MAELLTKNDYAYAEVRRLILGGQLGAGEVIPQARLAKELGLSTTPLREAIRRLAAEGLVEVSAHRDARVAALTADEAAHVYEVRETLDPMAAGLAAERRTDADVSVIEERLGRLTPLQVGDVDAMLAHRAFHQAVYGAAHNPVLTSALDQLWDKADRYRTLVLAQRPTRADQRRVAAEHRALAEAVRDGDAEGAAQVMLTHVLGSHGRRAIETLAADEAG